MILPPPIVLSGIIADVGVTANSSDTLNHLLANKPQTAWLIGEIVCHVAFKQVAALFFTFKGPLARSLAHPPLPISPFRRCLLC